MGLPLQGDLRAAIDTAEQAANATDAGERSSLLQQLSQQLSQLQGASGAAELAAAAAAAASSASNLTSPDPPAGPADAASASTTGAQLQQLLRQLEALQQQSSSAETTASGSGSTTGTSRPTAAGTVDAFSGPGGEVGQEQAAAADAAAALPGQPAAEDAPGVALATKQLTLLLNRASQQLALQQQVPSAAARQQMLAGPQQPAPEPNPRAGLQPISEALDALFDRLSSQLANASAAGPGSAELQGRVAAFVGNATAGVQGQLLQLLDITSSARDALLGAAAGGLQYAVEQQQLLQRSKPLLPRLQASAIGADIAGSLSEVAAALKASEAGGGGAAPPAAQGAAPPPPVAAAAGPPPGAAPPAPPGSLQRLLEARAAQDAGAEGSAELIAGVARQFDLEERGAGRGGGGGGGSAAGLEEGLAGGAGADPGAVAAQVLREVREQQEAVRAAAAAAAPGAGPGAAGVGAAG
jgi:hypothetical protein